MTSERRQARILAMQALCQWEVQQNSSSESLNGFLAAQHASPAVVGYTTQLVETFWKKSRRVDREITSAVQKWEFSRVSTVERNIMRVAVVELLGEKVPAKVALNEAIEIGREFGGEQSPQFINGVLDKILKNLSEREKDGV